MRRVSTAGVTSPGKHDETDDGRDGTDAVARMTVDQVEDLLRRGTLEVQGRITEASNTTLRAQISLDGVDARCVYKPVRGERPLWDFPDGTLAGREVSAYLLGAERVIAIDRFPYRLEQVTDALQAMAAFREVKPVVLPN